MNKKSMSFHFAIDFVLKEKDVFKTYIKKGPLEVVYSNFSRAF